MNIQQIEEALTIPETGLRCQRVLDEVQPVLRQLMEEFKARFAGQAPELLDYVVHTYEVTLRTTMHDSRNPKYAESKINSNIGKKAFIELIDKSLFETEYSVFMLVLNSADRKLSIIQSSDFYPFLEVLRSQGNMRRLTNALEILPDDVDIIIGDKEDVKVDKAELIPYLQQCIKEKRRPRVLFGTQIDFDQIPPTGELVTLMWNTWNKLMPIRQFRHNEAISESHSLTVMSRFNAHTEEFTITLYGKQYEVKFDHVTEVRPNQLRKQEFGLYDKGQLLVQGKINQYLRLPSEEIGLQFASGQGVLFSKLRTLEGTGQVEWQINKSFKLRGNEQAVELNKQYLSRAIAELADHDIPVEGNTFLVGTWDNDTRQFVEPIVQIKKRLIIAAAIFTDCIGYFVFPKETINQDPNSQPDNGDEDETPELFEHDFNLNTILSNVHGSPFTYSDAIIRDFHLNLVSLEDKHFVILNGISGTGKTRLCLLYANAVYGQAHDCSNPYLRVIPVRPDWTDSTSLFGYYSALEKRYVRTPFLNAVLQAIQEGKPMFIVLDEMNLARIEYYLSDYLSAIESRQPIRLHTEEHITDVPQELHIPNNLYVIGTINVDETTHSISDKVLDRAFVMTLSDVDLDQYWSKLDSKYKILDEEWKLLQELHRQLSRYDLHFGYRTMNEMLRKLYVNAELDPDIRMDKQDAVDRVIAEKVLPKIRGDERVDPLLVSLIDWTSKQFGDGSESLHHLLRMKGELDRYGATQFWR